jgi:hypothetical protein
MEITLSMEDEALACHGKLLLWKGRVNPEIWQHFLK